MRYVAALVAVDDVARSRRFYEGLLGQTVESDYGENVAFKGGFSIHLKSHFSALLDGRPIGSRANDAELYFEDDDPAGVAERVQAAGFELIHGAREQPWRQLVARFYDPDGHIVEVGERLERLAWRLSEEGLGLDEISRVTYLSRPDVQRAVAGYSSGLLGVAIESDRLLQVAIRHDFDGDIFREFPPAVATYMWPAPTGDMADTRAFVDSSIDGLRAGKELQLVILDKASGEFIGCSGLHALGRSDPELGIWTKLSSHGHGYGREAVAAIVAWARANVPFERLRYPVDKRNVASRRIPESLGGVVKREYRQLNQAGFELDEAEYWIAR